MRVLLVVTRGDIIGGASVHTVQLAKSLSEKGHQVCLVFGESEGKVADLCRGFKIDYVFEPRLVRSIRPFNDLRCIFALAKIIRNFKPNLIHLHSSKAALLGRIAAYFCKIPVVITVHGWPFMQGTAGLRYFIYLGLERLMKRLCSHFIVVSTADLTAGKAKLGLTDKQVSLIYNGIENSESSVADKSDTITTTCKLICIARFEKQKRQDVLLRALALIENKEWELTFVGDGPLRFDVEKLVSQLHLTSRVKFAGEQTNIDVWLQASDVFVLISDWESLPISIIEAMRAELAIVATDVGGVSELIIDNQSGMLIGFQQQEDLQQLSAVLYELMTNQMKSRSLGLKARQRFLSLFTAEHMVLKTLKCYERIVQEHK